MNPQPRPNALRPPTRTSIWHWGLSALGYIVAVSEPEVLYEAVLLRDDGDGIVYQAGAFQTEDEAQKVLDILRVEGQPEPMTINLVPVYQSAEDWQADR
jgi:hypothetical protein